MRKIITIIGASVLIGSRLFAQVSESEAIDMALKNNLMIKSGEFQIAAQRKLKSTAFDLGKTNITWMRGQFNSILNDNNVNISQSIPFPTTMISESKLAQERVVSTELDLAITRNDLIMQVRGTYHQLLYLKELHKELVLQDSLLKRFAAAAAVRYRVGEGTLLEKTSAETQQMEVDNLMRQNTSDMIILHRMLRTLLNSHDEIEIQTGLQKISIAADDATIITNPHLRKLHQEVLVAEQIRKVESSKLLPDFTVGYFTQSLIGFQRVDNADVFFDKNKRFTGFELGIAIPLWFIPQQKRIQAQSSSTLASEMKLKFFESKMEGELQQAQLTLAKFQNSLRYYEEGANVNADLILSQSLKSFEAGEISYLEYLQAINQARNIKLKYLETLNAYNQAALRLDFLSANF